MIFFETTIANFTSFCRVCFVNMSLRNTVIRKLKQIKIFWQFFFDAFCQTIDVNISVVKRLYIIYFNIREEFSLNFLRFFYYGFRCTHCILRIKWEKYNFFHTFFNQISNPCFNAWFCISHPYFYRNIY